MIEYRIGWAASTNIGFRDYTDWEPWHDEDATESEVDEALYGGGAGNCEGLHAALEASGFEWWVETRAA